MPSSNQKRASAAMIATLIAIPCEGLRRAAYYDPPGILTVCQGHTGADIVKGKVYSLAECNAFLTADMRKAVAIVDQCAPGLPEPVLAAFSDAAFNMGATVACDAHKSTAARLLKEHNYRPACLQLLNWNKARVAGILIPLPGLTKRRILEKDLCLSNI
jgi:lysozyme